MSCAGDVDVDDDVPQLSSHTLAVLQEFYREQADKEQELNQALHGKIDTFTPQENWVSDFVM
jgi:hypothetical protein